ncbi:TetR/AcrR family transcriptional regulator [Nocardia sp. MW-W600-9]
MGRPATYSVDALVAAAAELFAAGGARALTMSAVARALGAPSGSVYHRFPDRPALLAAVWLHTVRDFQAGYLRTIGGEPTSAAAIRAGEWIVDWCRERPASAAVLHAGVQAFAPDLWSAESRRELESLHDTQAGEIKRLVGRVSTDAGLPAEQAQFAMFDLPLAVVRRHLITGDVPPPEATALVRALTTAIFDARPDNPRP